VLLSRLLTIVQSVTALCTNAALAESVLELLARLCYVPAAASPLILHLMRSPAPNAAPPLLAAVRALHLASSSSTDSDTIVSQLVQWRHLWRVLAMALHVRTQVASRYTILSVVHLSSFFRPEVKFY
jgi:hypothetical protein